MCSLVYDDFVLFLSCNYIFLRVSFVSFPLLVSFVRVGWFGWVTLGLELCFGCHKSGRLGLRSFITFMFMFMGYPKPICDFLALSISASVEVLSYAGICLMNPFLLYIRLLTLTLSLNTLQQQPPQAPPFF